MNDYNVHVAQSESLLLPSRFSHTRNFLWCFWRELKYRKKKKKKSPQKCNSHDLNKMFDSHRAINYKNLYAVHTNLLTEILTVLLSAVDAGHQAVIFDRFRGVQEAVVGEGTHFLIPWVQKPIIFDCRSRPRNVPVITGSKGTINCLLNCFHAVLSFLVWVF